MRHNHNFQISLRCRAGVGCAKRFSQRKVGGVYKEMKKMLAKAQCVPEREGDREGWGVGEREVA